MPTVRQGSIIRTPLTATGSFRARPRTRSPGQVRIFAGGSYRVAYAPIKSSTFLLKPYDERPCALAAHRRASTCSVAAMATLIDVLLRHAATASPCLDLATCQN